MVAGGSIHRTGSGATGSVALLKVRLGSGSKVPSLVDLQPESRHTSPHLGRWGSQPVSVHLERRRRLYRVVGGVWRSLAML